MTTFTKRVFGAVVVKAVNSNYNADFTGQPRTLPNGTSYATDKAFKYTVRNFIRNFYPNEKIFYFRELKEDMNPKTMEEKYKSLFPENNKTEERGDVIVNLLSCLDIRLFGATYTGTKNANVSIHGPVQIAHGVNLWKESNVYTEQITSPFSSTEGKEQTTIGRQSKLDEGHYLHHFSINPRNLDEIIHATKVSGLTTDDIAKLKEGMRKGATYYDSTSKVGTENELLIWVELKEGSKLVLPSFLNLITVENEKQDGRIIFDLTKLSDAISKYRDQVDKVEIHVNNATAGLKGGPDNAILKDLLA